MCIRYLKEERVLNDIFELFNEANSYPAAFAKKMNDQIYFKIVLDYCELKKPDHDKIVETTDNMKY